MSSAFDSIMRGLEDVKAHREGTITLPTHKILISPISEFTSTDVKNIRSAIGVSQRVFAEIMGVSQKTVEAWESGRNHPSGAARRLLTVMQKDHEFVRSEKILIEY